MKNLSKILLASITLAMTGCGTSVPPAPEMDKDEMQKMAKDHSSQAKNAPKQSGKANAHSAHSGK